MIPTLEMHLLGSCTFRIGGQVVTLATRAAAGIAVYVAHQPHPVAREQLMLLFFASSTPKQAAGNMRRELSTIKKTLGDYFEIDRHAIAAKGKLIEIDTVGFEERVGGNDGRRTILRDAHDSADHGQNDQLLATNNQLANTLSTYRGDFLAGFYVRDAPEFELWIARERERLRLLAINGFVRLLRQQQSAREWQSALQTAQRLTAMEPLLEEAQQAKLLLLARTGQRALALKHYQQLVTLFDEELGVTLSAETNSIHSRILRASTPPAHNLQAASISLVGRKAESDIITQLLNAPERPVVTILGMGGIGKSSLARQIGQRIVTQSAGSLLDGVYFISLTTADSAEALISQLAATLNMPPARNKPLREQLLGWLSDRELLLILDNLEQLADDSAAITFLSELHAAAPRLRLLLTSRRRLNISNEVIVDLMGLALPEVGDSAENIITTGSATLFLQAAQGQQADFQPDSAACQTIADICHMLGGVPLALELAAAWSRYLSPAEIKSRIASSFEFLATDAHGIPDRQRSLRTVFDYSWRLLASAERTALAQLSLFPDSFDAAGASAVADATPRLLAKLIDSSLLQRRTDKRYAIHPLVGEFAQQQLTAADRTACLASHSAHYAQFLQTHTTTHRPTYKRNIPLLIAEHANLMLAWETTLASLLVGDGRAWQWIEALRSSMSGYLLRLGRYDAINQLFGNARRALEAAGWHGQPYETTQRLLHAQLASTDCLSRWIMGEMASLIPEAEALLPVLRANDAPKDLATVLNMLVQLHIWLNNHTLVPDLLAELKAACTLVDEPATLSTYLMSQSFFENVQGNIKAALALSLEALEVVYPLDDGLYQSRILENCARRMQDLGQTEEAFAALQQSAEFALKDGGMMQWALATKQLGRLNQDMNNDAEALSCYAESLPVIREHNDQRSEAELVLWQTEVFIKQAHAGEAALWPQIVRQLRATMRQTQRRQMASLTLLGISLYGRYLLHFGEAETAALLATYALNADAASLQHAAQLQASVDEIVEGAVVSAETQAAIKKQATSMTLDDAIAITFKPRRLHLA